MTQHLPELFEQNTELSPLGAIRTETALSRFPLHRIAKRGNVKIELRDQVRQLAPKYADIVIDVGGRDTGSLRAALTVADIVLIPVKPRSFDLWGVDQTVDLIREAREINEGLRAVAVLNEADPQGKDNAASIQTLQEIAELDVAPVMLVRRKAFPNAAASGLSVLEYDDPKASDEFTQLTDFLSVYLNEIGAISHGNRKES